MPVADWFLFIFKISYIPTLFFIDLFYNYCWTLVSPKTRVKMDTL